MRSASQLFVGTVKQTQDYGNGHWGVDYDLTGGGTDNKNLVRSVANGRIIDFWGGCVRQSGSLTDGCGGGFGNWVVVRHRLDNKDGPLVYSLYAHLDELEPGLKKLECIQAGDPVGELGHTGKSDGEHLHLEINDSATAKYGYAPTRPAGSYNPKNLLGKRTVYEFCDSAPAPEAPGVPRSFSVRLVGSDATLRWQAPASGPTPTSYQYTKKNLDTKVELDPRSTTATSAKLPVITGEPYEFKVRACNGSSCSGWAISGPHTQQDYRAELVDKGVWRNADLTGQVDPSDVVAGQTYWMRIRYRNVGAKSWSASQPTRLAPVSGAGQARSSPLYVTGSWDGPTRIVRMGQSTRAPGDVASFKFPVRIPQSTGPLTEPFQIVIERVAWVAGSRTEVGFTVNPSPTPGVPTALAVSTGEREATLTWQPPSGGAAPTSYQYMKKNLDTGDTLSRTSTTTAGTLAMIPGSPYQFRVRACANGACGAWTSWSATYRVEPVGVGSPVVPLRPVRLLETRVGSQFETVDGLFEGIGERPARSVTEFTVMGRGGVASGAGSVFLNVAAVRPDGAGFLTVFPCGEPVPLASTLNYAPGQVVANSVLAKVGEDGKVCIYTHAATHLIADINAAEVLAAPTNLAVAEGDVGCVPAQDGFPLSCDLAVSAVQHADSAPGDGRTVTSYLLCESGTSPTSAWDSEDRCPWMDVPMDPDNEPGPVSVSGGYMSPADVAYCAYAYTVYEDTAEIPQEQGGGSSGSYYGRSGFAGPVCFYLGSDGSVTPQAA